MVVIEIPLEFQGKALGREGSLENWSNFSGISNIHLNGRVLTIEGEAEAVKILRYEVLKTIPSHVATIPLPSALIKRVIGKKYRNILRWKRCGVKVEVKDNVVLVKGYEEDVEAVCNEIRTEMNSEVRRISKTNGFIADFYASYVDVDPSEEVTVVECVGLNYVKQLRDGHNSLNEVDKLACQVESISLEKGVFFRHERDLMMKYLESYLAMPDTQVHKFSYTVQLGKSSVPRQFLTRESTNATSLYHSINNKVFFIPSLTECDYTTMKKNLILNGFKLKTTKHSIVVYLVDVNTGERKSVTLQPLKIQQYTSTIDIENDKVFKQLDDRMPSICKVCNQIQRNGFLNLLHVGDVVNARLKISSKDALYENFDSEVRRTVEEAWRTRSQSGKLKTEGENALQIITTRFQTRELFEQDGVHVKLAAVTTDDVLTYTVDIKSIGLKHNPARDKALLNHIDILLQKSEKIRKFLSD
jgi:hypothetical protein